jgi:hypothetical protein
MKLMRRGFVILMLGGIFLVVSASIAIPSIYAFVGLAESMPSNITTKDVIQFALNMNQTAIKESLRSIGIDAGLAFFGILVSVTLMVNGIIALIGGTIIIFLDKRRSKHTNVQI